MDLTNTNFIVTTATGNKVINPQSTLDYKDILFFGNGYYEWGKVLNQNLATIIDKVSVLEDGGVAQATFDANQFIDLFIEKQDTALNLHTSNLLTAIDTKLNQEITSYNSGFNTEIDNIKLSITSLETGYIDADNALKLEMINDYNELVLNTKNNIESTINTLNDNYVNFRNDISIWKISVDPKINSFSDNFGLYKTEVNAEIANIKNDIILKYDYLNTITNTLNTNITNANEYVVTLANNYTDAEILKATGESSNAIIALEDSVTTLQTKNSEIEQDIVDINNNFVNYVPITNTILTDAKAYTNTEIGKITGTTGTLTTHITNYNTFKSTTESEISSLETKVTTLETNYTGLNTSYNTFVTDTNTSLLTLTNTVTTNQTNLDTRLDTIETTYESNWKTYTDSVTEDLEIKVDANKTSITNIESDITVIEDKLITLTNKDVSMQSEIDDLKARVTTTEDGTIDITAINTSISNALTESKTYTDNEIDTIEIAYKAADTATLASSKSYTDSKVSEFSGIYALDSEVSYLQEQITTNKNDITDINNNKLTVVNNRLTDLETDVNNNKTEIDAKIIKATTTLDNQIEIIKQNYVTYDTVFPILKKVFGYVIENKITKTESDELFDNIINMFKDETIEQTFNNYIIGIDYNDTTDKVIIIGYFPKEYFSAVSNFYCKKDALSYSNTGISSLQPFTQFPGYFKTTVEIPDTIDLDIVKSTLNYKNEFGFDTTNTINLINSLGEYIFKFNKFETVGSDIYININCFNTTLIINKVIRDEIELETAQYTIVTKTLTDGSKFTNIRTWIGTVGTPSNDFDLISYSKNITIDFVIDGTNVIEHINIDNYIPYI